MRGFEIDADDVEEHFEVELAISKQAGLAGSSGENPLSHVGKFTPNYGVFITLMPHTLGGNH